MRRKPERLILFLPAILIGLLAGWLISRALPRPEAADSSQSPPLSAAPQLPSAPEQPQPAAGGGREQWLKMLEARTLPPVSKNFTLLSTGLEKLSPARRNLTIELTRGALSGIEINGTSLTFPFNQGDAGFAETCARLAKTEPGRALFQIEMAADGFPGRWSADTLNRARRLVMREWLRKNPREALEKIADKNRPPSFQRGQRLEMLMGEWAALDPAAAAAALPEFPENGPGFDRQSLAGSLLRIWQSKDPAAARGWAETEADPAWRESLLRAADEFSATDPAARTTLLLAAPERDSAKLTATLGPWLSSDPGAALEKLATLPAGDPFWSHDAAHAAQRWAAEAHISTSTTFSRGTLDPDAFLETLQAIPAGARREALLQGLVDFGASNNIPFALRILEELGESPARVRSVSTLTELWMRQDPVRASEWLAGLPPDSESRQAGVARLAENLAPDDPERAAQWAATLPDSFPQKETVLRNILTQWSAKDPAAAEAWRKTR